MVRALAGEQLAGRLQIAPRAVNSSSEVLTSEGRAMATRAWHVPPFQRVRGHRDRRHRRGMHLFEDQLIPEVVDDAYRQVPGSLCRQAEVTTPREYMVTAWQET